MGSVPDDSVKQLDVTARFVNAAQGVILEHGLAGASARRIADRARASASAIHYHFGDVDTVVCAAMHDARERDRNWRSSLLNGLQHAELDSELFSFFLIGVINAAGCTFRDLALFRWDVALQGTLRGRMQNIAAQWRDDLNTFWKSALRAYGVTAPASLVAEFADAVVRIYLAAGNGPTHIAWVTETTARFAERIRGESPRVRRSRIWRDLHRHDVAPTHSKDISALNSATAARIVDGALKVILSQGTHALTHRSVAAAAGVSLSSTTYYFSSRGEILHAAFAQLRANALARTMRPEVRAGRVLTLDELIERMGTALVQDSSEVSREYLAAQSLLHAAARDEALKPHSQQLYASMGDLTLTLFRRTRELSKDADALLAFIFALWTDAMLCNASLESAESVALHVRTQQRAMARLLFRKKGE